MKKFCLIFGFSSLLWGCSVIQKYPSDNAAEEFAERVIENETGLDLDLSPWDSDDPDDEE